MAPTDNITVENSVLKTDSNHFVGNLTYYPNLDQDVIIITSDRLTICLKDHLENISKKDKWLTPLSLFLTFIVVFLTSEFKAAFNIPATTWQAVFVISSIVSFVWFLRSLIESIKCKSSFKDLISDVKKISEEKKSEKQKEDARMKQAVGG